MTSWGGGEGGAVFNEHAYITQYHDNTISYSEFDPDNDNEQQQRCTSNFLY